MNTIDVEYIKNAIQGRGIVLLSKRYKNMHFKMLWRCEVCGCKFRTSAAKVLYRKQGCPKCGAKKCIDSLRLTIDTIQARAKGKNMSLLSKVYHNLNDRLLWKCNICTHQWIAGYYYTVMGKGGCPICAKHPKRGRTHKLTIQCIRDRIKNKPLILLSDKYVNNSSNLLWKCKACGEQWDANCRTILSGTGCPQCTPKRKKRLSDVQQFAKNTNASLMSNSYSNNKVKMQWKCNLCGHEWMASFNSISQGYGCPKCSSALASKKRRIQFEHIKQYVNRNLVTYDLVSNASEYLDVRSYLSLRCRVCGLISQARWDKISSKRKICNCRKNIRRKNESEVLRLLCDKYGVNNVVYQFRLLPHRRIADFVIPSKHLWIEYDGIQHFKPIDYWGGKRNLARQKKVDEGDPIIAKEMGLILVRIRHDEDKALAVNSLPL